MRAHLLYPEADFDWQWTLQAAAEREAARTRRRHDRIEGFDPRKGLPWNSDALIADLGLEAVFLTMAGEDDCIFEASKKIILQSQRGDISTIKYRQDVLRDCLEHPAIVGEVYAIVTEALEKPKGYLGILAKYPELSAS